MTRIFAKSSLNGENEENSTNKSASASKLSPEAKETKEDFLVSLITSGAKKSQQPLNPEEKEGKSPRNKQSLLGKRKGWWQKLSLRRKAIIIAVALGALPVIFVGGIAYQLSANSVKERIIKEHENRTVGIRDAFRFALAQLVDDAGTIAHSPPVYYS